MNYFLPLYRVTRDWKHATAVGSIPMVGGMLAAAIGILMEVLYAAVKKKVERAFDDIMSLLQVKLVTEMVDAVSAYPWSFLTQGKVRLT